VNIDNRAWSLPPKSCHVVDVPVFGGLDKLTLTERTVSEPGTGEVLIQVRAAGVNRGDLKQRKGDYPRLPQAAPSVLGLEVAGVVVRVGGMVQCPKVGDSICALLVGGGYAEFCVAPAEQCLPIPHGLDYIEAAALPETHFTVWNTLFDQARLQPGESVLVHGGASGIGTTAIQMASALGSRVFATAGSAEKCVACENLGAERAINYHDEDFAQRVLELTQGAGVDVILDIIGGPYAKSNMDALAVDGRLCYLAGDLGPDATFNIRQVMLKRATITGATLRHRTVADKARIAQSLKRRIWPLLERGRIVPIVHQVFPLEAVSEAHRVLESGEVIGKLVLSVEQSRPRGTDAGGRSR